jgi:hypothetical protein
LIHVTALHASRFGIYMFHSKYTQSVTWQYFSSVSRERKAVTRVMQNINDRSSTYSFIYNLACFSFLKKKRNLTRVMQNIIIDRVYIHLSTTMHVLVSFSWRESIFYTCTPQRNTFLIFFMISLNV